MLEKWRQDQDVRHRLAARRRAGTQKMGGLCAAKPTATSTESYDLSILDELDLPDV
jgi:hypothetical protein